MINLKMNFLSQALNMRRDINVIMPEFFEIEENKKLPVVYLLHGLTGSCDDWLYMGKAKSIASKYNVIFVMPSASNSFYTDMKYGANYFEHIAYEIPNYTESILPINTSKRYVAGLSMGGYGALKIALTNPERYKACASFSGVVDIVHACKNLGREDLVKELINCFGESLEVPSKDNLFELAKNDKVKDLSIYMSCGTEDFLFEENQNFYKANKDLNITYKTEPGEHEWRLWEKNLAVFMQNNFKEKQIV